MHRDVAICNGAITVLGSISMACCDLYCPDLCKYVRVCVCAYVCDFFWELFGWKRVYAWVKGGSFLQACWTT